MTAVLAFLQNMWVRDPEKARALVTKYGEEYRRRLVTYALFAGCLTGRRLKAAFGEDMCKAIVWEEASPEIAGDPRTVLKPDAGHIQDVLATHTPGVVITFGKVAADAVTPLWRGPLIKCVHPAARQKDTVQRLNEAAAKLAALAEVKEIKEATK